MPVVRGAKDQQYKRETKHYSYINTLNYESPQSLAYYLNYLDRNETAYLEYFSWKIDLYRKIKLNLKSKKKFKKMWNSSPDYHLRQPFCTMCSLLHNESYLKSSNNKQWKLSEWFSIKTNCWDSEESRTYLYKIVKFFGFCF